MTSVGAVICWGCGESDSKSGDSGSDGTASVTTTVNSTGSGATSTTTGSTTGTTSGGGSGATGDGGASSGGTSSTTGEAGASDTGGSAGAAGAPSDTGSGGTAATGGSGGTGGGATGVDIIEDCSYTACGGELDDSSWQYTRVCVEESDLLGLFSAACDAVELVSSSGEVSGNIDFSDPDFNQDLTLSLTAEFNIPASCNLNCTLIGALLTAGGIGDASCTTSDDGCACSGTLEGSATTTGEYATDNDTLTLDGADETYCADDTTLKHTGSIQGVPVVFQARRD